MYYESYRRPEKPPIDQLLHLLLHPYELDRKLRLLVSKPEFNVNALSEGGHPLLINLMNSPFDYTSSIAVCLKYGALLFQPHPTEEHYYRNRRGIVPFCRLHSWWWIMMPYLNREAENAAVSGQVIVEADMCDVVSELKRLHAETKDLRARIKKSEATSAEQLKYANHLAEHCVLPDLAILAAMDNKSCRHYMDVVLRKMITLYQSALKAIDMCTSEHDDALFSASTLIRKVLDTAALTEPKPHVEMADGIAERKQLQTQFKQPLKALIEMCFSGASPPRKGSGSTAASADSAPFLEARGGEGAGLWFTPTG